MTSQPNDDPSSDSAKRPTWPEIAAYDMLLRDREAYLRRRGWWGRMFKQTELLESLRSKMRRIFHADNSDAR